MQIFTSNLLAERFNKTSYEWNTRLDKIKKVISDFIDSNHSEGLKVICLQEVELDDIERDFKGFFAERGYQYVHHSKTKKRTSPIGNLTAWPASIKLEKVDYTSTAVITALRAETETISEMETMTIANIHLKAGIKSQTATRVSQLKSVMTHSPDIVVGDFNDDFRDSNDLLNLLKGYNQSESINTVWADDRVWAFDAVFSRIHTRRDEPEGFKVVSSAAKGPIPNDDNPSDHVPLVAVLS